MDTNVPVLVVDDYRTMRRIIANLLREIGFTEIDEAESAVAALEKLGQRQFGLVISDWNMTEASGLDLLRQIRASDAWRGLPFIMVTAEASMEHVVEAKAAGVSSYLLKPFTAETLKAKIAAVM